MGASRSSASPTTACGSHADNLTAASRAPEHVLAAFGFEAGGWQVDRHPRFVADTTGDGRADIVGFADDGVWISREQPDGSFSAPEHVVAGFGFGAEAGGWQVDRHPRFMADTTGDGRADIVGFGNDGVWIVASPTGRQLRPAGARRRELRL